MLTDKHRHKLIEGLVGAMGGAARPTKAPVVVAIEHGGSSSDDAGGAGDEGSPAEEGAESPDEETSEGMKCARDLGNALGIDDIDDTKARAIVEAIKTIAGGYESK